VGFDVTDQLLITSFVFVRYCRKKCEYNETVHQLFVDFKKAYDSVRRESIVQYSHRVWGTHESDNFPIQNYLKQGDALTPIFFNFALECAIRNVQENQVLMKLNGTNQLLVYADDVNLLGDIINAKNRNTDTLIDLVRRLV
jgi:hypothetical protein